MQGELANNFRQLENFENRSILKTQRWLDGSKIPLAKQRFDQIYRPINTVHSGTVMEKTHIVFTERVPLHAAVCRTLAVAPKSKT